MSAGPRGSVGALKLLCAQGGGSGLLRAAPSSITTAHAPAWPVTGHARSSYSSSTDPLSLAVCELRHALRPLWASLSSCVLVPITASSVPTQSPQHTAGTQHSCCSAHLSCHNITCYNTRTCQVRTLGPEWALGSASSSGSGTEGLTPALRAMGHIWAPIPASVSPTVRKSEAKPPVERGAWKEARTLITECEQGPGHHHRAATSLQTAVGYFHTWTPPDPAGACSKVGGSIRTGFPTQTGLPRSPDTLFSMGAKAGRGTR